MGRRKFEDMPVHYGGNYTVIHTLEFSFKIFTCIIILFCESMGSNSIHIIGYHE
jgi:hypothetical protein